MLSLLRRREGQGTVEFALVLPLLITTLLAILELSWVMFQTIAVNHVCRAATRRGTLPNPAINSDAALTQYIQDTLRGLWKPTTTLTFEVFSDNNVVGPANQRGSGWNLKITIVHRLQFFTPLMDTFNREENQTTIQASSQFQCE